MDWGIIGSQIPSEEIEAFLKKEWRFLADRENSGMQEELRPSF